MREISLRIISTDTRSLRYCYKHLQRGRNQAEEARPNRGTPRDEASGTNNEHPTHQPPNFQIHQSSLFHRSPTPIPPTHSPYRKNLVSRYSDHPTSKPNPTRGAATRALRNSNRRCAGCYLALMCNQQPPSFLPLPPYKHRDSKTSSKNPR